MQELASGLYVPLGYQVLPRMSAVVLAEHVGAGTAQLVFLMPEGQGTIAVPASAFVALERAVLSDLEVTKVAARELDGAVDGEPTRSRLLGRRE